MLCAANPPYRRSCSVAFDLLGERARRFLWLRFDLFGRLGELFVNVVAPRAAILTI